MSTAGSLTRDHRQQWVGGVAFTLVSIASMQSLVGELPVRAYKPASQPVDYSSSHRSTANRERGVLPGASVAGMLKDLLDQLGISKASLAQWLGVSRPTLYAWTAGGEVRDGNLDRIVALRAAIDKLASATAEGKLPPLWQHQRLPQSGSSFAQGMRTGLRPETMAAELQAMWARDTEESAVVEALFRRRT